MPEVKLLDNQWLLTWFTWFRFELLISKLFARCFGTLWNYYIVVINEITVAENWRLAIEQVSIGTSIENFLVSFSFCFYVKYFAIGVICDEKVMEVFKWVECSEWKLFVSLACYFVMHLKRYVSRQNRSYAFEILNAEPSISFISYLLICVPLQCRIVRWRRKTNNLNSKI